MGYVGMVTGTQTSAWVNVNKYKNLFGFLRQSFYGLPHVLHNIEHDTGLG